MSKIFEALNAAVQFHQSGNLAEARRRYAEILHTAPRNADAWHLLGLVEHAEGEFGTALTHIRRAILIDRRQPTFHNHLAEVYRSLGQLPEAERSCRQALRLKPDFAIAHNTLGLVLAAHGNVAEATASYRAALECKPDFAQAHFNLGAAQQATSHFDEAIACYRRAIECHPDFALAYFTLAQLLQSRGQVAEAAECYRQAIRCQPHHAEAHNNLGTLYKQQHQLAEAIECYTRALECQPDFAEALNNLGNVFKTQGRGGEAMICYEQSVRIKPESAQAHYNRGLMLLAAGHFADGWREYESRWHCPDFPKREFAEPRWQGESLAGRVLLVHAEQGLGDVLQFIRYMPLLSRFERNVIVELPRPLLPLVRHSGIGPLVARGDSLPRFDLHVSLLALPGIFGTTLDTIPNQVPYLAADPELVTHWAGVLRARAGFKVGIAWQGSPSYPGDRLRSIPLPLFEPLAQAGVELISLQKGPGSEQLAEIAGKFAVRDLGVFDEAHGPFMDTAAVMTSLDLVITSDSAVAHLAGALGVPVWLALPLSADWRWMFERDDSPWYPTMRLFRQTGFDEWQPVFERMAAALRSQVAAAPPA